MKEKPRLLIVDDEPAIRLFLSEELVLSGYRVSTVGSGEEALALLQQESIDLVLLDLRMGGLSGLQVLEELNRLSRSPVVIILTAYGDINSAIAALRQGAVDYLRKPCTSEELLASVARGLTRRAQDLRQQTLVQLIEDSAQQLRALAQIEPATPAESAGPRFLEARGLLLDRERWAVSRRGGLVELTPTEFKLLLCLVERADRPLSFAEMAYVLHGTSEDEASARQSLGTHVWRLRRKLGRGPDGKDYIVNVHGRGYKFVS